MTSTIATLLSTLATAAGVALVVPQIIKTLRTKQASGVSLGGLIASFFSWYLWVPYTLSTGDLRGTIGLVVPGAVQGVAVLVAFKYKADRTGLLAPVVMVAVVASTLVFGGWGPYMAVLGTTTIWAYAPSIVSAARSKDISGISLGAWWMTVLYGVSWVGFGLISGAGGLVYTGSMNAGLALVVLLVVHYRTKSARLATSEFVEIHPAALRKSPTKTAAIG
jgi:uncharacterized protein with PQ loop repeat